VASKPRVGREKDPDVEKILALAPDLVIANIEENRRDAVLALRAAGVAVWVTFPRTVWEGIQLVRELGDVTGSPDPAGALAGRLERRYEETARATARAGARRVFCPIWRGPYMTIGPDTYVHDMLRVCGGANIFADRPERYPTVTLEEAQARAPEAILLPDEPYRFRAAHLADLDPWPGLRALTDGRLHFVDGKLLSWYGPRIGEALERLPPLLGAWRP
jgi:ABC-type Fe3+-hydroxamate transport system substrate-binding protein